MTLLPPVSTPGGVGVTFVDTLPKERLDKQEK